MKNCFFYFCTTRKEKTKTEIYDYLDAFNDGVIYYNNDGKNGFINIQGEIVLPFKYYIPLNSYFSEGMVTVNNKRKISKSKKSGYINTLGELMIPYKYQYAGRFSEGLAMVKLNDKYGYIDTKENIVIPFKYDNASTFSEGLAAVKKNGKYGYIDKKENVIIPFEYDDAYLFSEGLAVVRKNDKYGFIDERGEIVLTFNDLRSPPSEFWGGLARLNIQDPKKEYYVDVYGNIYYYYE